MRMRGSIRAPNILLLPLAIDFSAVLDLVNQDNIFLTKDFINDAIIANAKLEESCQISREGDGSSFIQIIRSPIRRATVLSSRSRSRVAA